MVTGPRRRELVTRLASEYKKEVVHRRRGRACLNLGRFNNSGIMELIQLRPTRSIDRSCAAPAQVGRMGISNLCTSIEFRPVLLSTVGFKRLGEEMIGINTGVGLAIRKEIRGKL